MTCPNNGRGPITGLLWVLPISIAVWAAVIWAIYHAIEEGLK